MDGAAVATSADILSAASHGMEMAAMVAPSPIVFPTTAAAESDQHSNNTDTAVGDNDIEGGKVLGGARLPGAGGAGVARGSAPRSAQIRM